MNARDREIALTVGCKLCHAPAGAECANSVDGRSPRDQPHHNRVVRGRIAKDTLDSDVAPNAGSSS